MKGMDARARLLGGSLDIVGTRTGTCLRVRLPLPVDHTACPAACPEEHAPRIDITNPPTVRTKTGSHLVRYLLATAFVGACLLLRLSVNEYLGTKFLSTGLFYPSVLLAAYYLGLGPALMAAAFSAIASRYFFMPPVAQLLVLPDGWNPLRLTFFLLGSTTLAWLVSRLQASKNQISALASEAIASRNQLCREQELLRLLIAEEEAEKQALCGRFHDRLIQHVAGSRMLLEATLRDSSENETLHEVINHLTKGIDDGRRVIRGVRPSVLDEPGLSGLLLELVEQFSTLGFAVDVDCSHSCNHLVLPEAIRTALFRICQEALTNSWKHSGCEKATVRIEKQGDYIRVEIDDNGRGMGARTRVAPQGFGLKGMDARARLLGGTLDVVSPGKGTRIRVHLPLFVEQTA